MPVVRLECSATLEAVTVYPMRAQLEWACRVAIAAAGDVVVVLGDGAHSQADRATLQVRARGGDALVLRGIQFVAQHTAQDVRPVHRAIEADMKAVERSLRMVDDEKEGCVAWREATDRVEAAILSGPGCPTTPQRYAEVSDRLRRERAEQAERMRDIMQRRDGLQKRVEELQRQKAALGEGERVTVRDEVQVRLTATAATSAELVVSYMVDGATWEAVYEADMDVTSKKLALTYFAVVKQSTITNWDAVNLRLSTAKPSVSGVPPEPPRWDVSLVPLPQKHARREKKRSGALRMASRSSMDQDECDDEEERMAPAPMMMQMFSANMFVPDGDGLPGGGGAPPPRMAIEEADVTTSVTAATFTIAGKTTIPCTGQTTRVVIMQRTLDIYPRYSAVPKLSGHTYLKVRLVNSTDYPLLPGEMKVLSGSAFVGTSSLDWVASGEDAWLFLGVDDSVSVKRTAVHQKTSQKSKGMLSSRKLNRIEYAYTFEVKNTKGSAQEIVVWDQLPLSSEEDVTVTLVTPNADTGCKYLVNDMGMIEWLWNLQPNKSAKFDFIFTVDYPVEATLSGI